jgi:hypothetical protein
MQLCSHKNPKEPLEKKTQFGHSFFLNLSKSFQHLLPKWATFHMSQYHMAFQVTKIKMASCWTFLLQASSLLPHSPWMSTKLLPTKISNSQPLEWTIHEQACSFQSLPKLAHASNHLNKSEFVKSHSFSSHLLEKLHHLPKLPSIHIFCNLQIPCKIVQLHDT